MFRTGVEEVMNTHTYHSVSFWCLQTACISVCVRAVTCVDGFTSPSPLLTGHRDGSSKTGSPRRTAVWTLPATGQTVGTQQATDAGLRTQELWTLLQSACAHSCDRGLRFEHASFCLMNFMRGDERMLLRRVFERMMQD